MTDGNAAQERRYSTPAPPDSSSRRSVQSSRSEIENVPPKARRPLPTPNENAVTVPASTFYASSSKPAVTQGLSPGSSRTSYIAPSSPPPSYHKIPSRDADPIIMDETGRVHATGPAENLKWGEAANNEWANVTTHWDTSANWAGGGWGPSSRVNVDGRDPNEEENWCDAELREKCKRPGPGILPPLLADLLHNPEHTLYSVTANPPSRPISSSVSSSSQPSASQPDFSPPTPDEVRTAIPHPNAYYCKEHNGWILLSWCSSSVLPPLARSFQSATPFPDQDRRRRTSSCIGDGEQPFGQVNMTHHFHRYERAVDARMLTTPFKRREWEMEEQQKGNWRKMTLVLDDVEIVEPESNIQDEKAEEEPEGDLLDLYLCCQCSTYCLVSQVIPGVIPLKWVEEFTKDKLSHPALDKSPQATLFAAWETVITIIENRLWKGESRILPVTRPRFQNKIGWNSVVRHIFKILGFNMGDVAVSTTAEQALIPPSTDPSTAEGKKTRSKLLRAWVEISAWLTIQKKSKSVSDALGSYVTQILFIGVESAREMYQTGIGAHVNQISRGGLPTSLVGYEQLNNAWEALGLTPSSYSVDLLLFAYFAQCRCDPSNTVKYFTYLYTIYETMKVLGEAPPDELQTVIAEERSRGRYTPEDLAMSASILGFGKDGVLGVDLDDEVDDQFILEAWKNGIRMAWRDINKGQERRNDLNDAFRIVGDSRGSPRLRQAWRERGSGMTPDAAYSTLEVPKDVDESMLLAVFSMRIEDQPNSAHKMREALSVIAEVTDSQRLRQFLETGRDPGDVTLTTSQDMPRGLNQLGNTCYLNSLLQYFYTIKDLRHAIAPLANADAKSLDDSKFTDDDLKRHRVGGRLVTRREIYRSKKFVNQLADLFWNLEYCEDSAVTPTLDLAKLALVTSQDEEEEDQDKTGTDSSNDTDATLVEDGPPRTYERSSLSPLTSPSGSVLGKRPRDPRGMEVDSPVAETDKDKETYVIVSKPPSPQSSASSSANPEASGSTSKLKAIDQDGDVEMQDISAKPPPLPPRKPRETDDSVMMFGRQHDVSECMDNCMFQIETALLDFQNMAGSEDDKTSVVKRLFYGKKRQRLTPLAPADDRQHQPSVHEKEDIFSHLHVNVSEEGYDLYDGLSRYFDDIVEFEGGVKKRMEVSLIDLPPLLQIQLQRVQFDRETQQAYKSQAYVKFGGTIYLDRFLDSADPPKKARSKAIQTELNFCRDRIQRLTQGKFAPFAPSLGGVVEFLSTQVALELPEADDKFVASLRDEQQTVASQLETERSNVVKLKQELEDVWKNDSKAAYELTSVFIHRGSSPSWGHYFFYSRNLPDKPDTWFKYNDSDVSVVTKDEVLADTTGSTANPYMLVFSRRDSDVIQTVHRFDPESLQDG